MRTLTILWAVLYGLAGVTPAITFTPGHYYATDDNTKIITQYDAQGHIVGSLNLPVTGEVRGIGFGPDGLMYGVHSPTSSQTDIIAFNSNGVVQRTYPFGYFWISGNISYGKIEFGPGGYGYVAGGSGIARFNVNNVNSFQLIPNTASNYDVQVLPNSHLLIAEGYAVKEIDLQGNLIRNLGGFVDIRGLQYDAVTNKIYVATLGSTGAYDQIYKLDYTTGQILKQTTFVYANDFFITSQRQLLVGSRTQSPGLFSMDLIYSQSLDGAEQMFVTQYIPEPATLLLLGLGGMMLRRKEIIRRKTDVN